MEQLNQNMNKEESAMYLAGIQNKKHLWEDVKLPPQAIHSEEAVLGALLSESAIIVDFAGILNVESFYKESHQRIYAAMVLVSADSSVIDLSSVKNQLISMGELEVIGGVEYLSILIGKADLEENIESHAQNIKDQYLKRKVIQFSSETQRLAYEDETNVFELLDKMEQQLEDLTKVIPLKN